MIKRLKALIFMFLAVIMPLAMLSACSMSEGGTDGNGSGGGDNSGGGNSPGNSSEAEYVLDKTEVNKVLKNSYDVCQEFIINLNSSNLLYNNNDYTSDVGTKTNSTFDYMFYPARFSKDYSGEFDKDTIYARENYSYNSIGFFEINVDDEQDKILVTILIDYRSNNDNNEDFEYYYYEYDVNNGDIESIKLSYLKANESLINFSEAFFDIKNSNCEIGTGNLSEFSSNRSYLNDKFTEEKFSLISSDKWGYSYYQKLSFLQTSKYVTLDKRKMPENEKLKGQFSKFGFLDAFEIFDEFVNLSNSSLTNLDKDYFLNVSSKGLVSFNSEYFRFELETEG